VPDAILLDVLLPGMDGWEVLRRLKRNQRLRDVPVMIVSAVGGEPAASLGALDYLVKPVDRTMLLDRLARHAFLPPAKPPARVLVIADDQASQGVITAHLRREGIDVANALDGVEGLRLAREHEFELVICD